MDWQEPVSWSWNLTDSVKFLWRNVGHL